MESKNLIRILLAEKFEFVRERFIRLIDGIGYIECIGEAVNEKEAIELSQKLQPDIVLIDILLSGSNGLDAAKIIKEGLPNIKILFLTMDVDSDYVRQAYQLNYEGIITKSIFRNEFLNAINIIAYGGKYFDAMILKNVANLNTSNSNKAEDQISITEREKDILKLIALNFCNREIAEKLFITSKTVEAHKHKLIAKLGMKNSRELHAYAISHFTNKGNPY